MFFGDQFDSAAVNGPEQGEDIRAVGINFEEAAFGVERK